MRKGAGSCNTANWEQHGGKYQRLTRGNYTCRVKGCDKLLLLFHLLPFASLLVNTGAASVSCLFSSCRGLYLPGNLQQGRHSPIIRSSSFCPSHRNVELISRGRECISELKHALTPEKEREGFLLLAPANVSCVESLCQ